MVARNTPAAGELMVAGIAVMGFSKFVVPTTEKLPMLSLELPVKSISRLPPVTLEPVTAGTTTHCA